jgi:hypothetical protein
MAAQTLIESGAKVTMLDVGVQSSQETRVPDGSFLELRKKDTDQYKYLIGKGASSVSWGDVGKGEQITPPRSHILKEVEKIIPVESDSFSPLESLGYGGLGIGWGLQSWTYTEADTKAAGLSTFGMENAYQLVAKRIGISAKRDDASPYTIRGLKDFQEAAHMDRNHEYIYKKYENNREKFNKQGFFLGRTPLALITKDYEGRKKYAYKDMDFYSDNDQSAWRPWITINRLRKSPSFNYVDDRMVVSFKERKDYTEVTTIKPSDGKKVTYRCRRLILAASALGSARVVLRSLGQPGDRLPLLCNPYSYVPSVQPKFFGREAEPKKLGFTQLSLFYDASFSGKGASVASLYSYQSLMLFRIIRHVPLDFKDALILMRYLQPAIVIMGIHHPDSTSNHKYVELIKSKNLLTGDKLKASYALDDDEKALIDGREKEFIRAMRRMGTFSLKRINPGYGASIHYAGTLPFSAKDKPFHLSPSGRLYGTSSVYVADSSGFNYLPAPGLTFSLMANAHITATNVISNA